MTELRVYLFGPPRVECDGVEVEIGRRKAVAILAYVAISGSPQSQIEAFRALEMSDEFMTTYGYPPLGNATAEGKLNQDKILGLNAAKVYGVDAEKTRCQVSACPMADIKRHFDEELGPRRWAFDPPGGPKTMEEWLEGAREMERTRRPG